MKYYSKVLIIVACVISATGYADTFKHKESGEVFTGFVTQKTAGGKTLVYNSEEGKMTPVVLNDYDIIYDSKGRKDNVFLLEFTSPEILLSDAVSTKVAAAITETSNRGPQAIIIQIDSPGGRGDYMKTVVDAILQTKNCPVIAYISGETYGGAYSAAAIVALACEKVYINPAAGIGSVSSASGGYLSDESYANHLSLYSSNTLLTYSSYVNAVAQKRDHSELLLRAFIDKRISIIEIIEVDDINVSRQFIGKDDRQPTQTLIRTLSEGMTASQSTTELSPEDVIGKVLNLTAQDAVDLGLATASAESAAEILSNMQMAEFKIMPIPGIETTIKKYTAAKRNISESLARIDFHEKNIESLNEQFTTIDKQLRLGTQTREVVRGEVGYRTRRNRERFPSNYGYYYYNTGDIARTGWNRRRNDNRYPTAEKITTEEPLVSIQLIYTQLTGSLRDLVSEYRKTLNLTKRWPGGLPPELNKSTLQKNMDSASAELDNLYRYRPVYPNQAQPQSQQRSDRYRRR